MTGTRASRRLAAGIVWGVALLACTSDPAVERDPSIEATTATIAVDAPEAADLRLRLEQQFGMFGEALAAGVLDPRASSDRVESAVAALTETISTAYDTPTAAEFNDIARRYSRALADFRTALDDEEGVPAARRAVTQLPGQLASFMAETTGGGMELTGTAALLRSPTTALLEMVAAAVEGDHETAYARRRDVYADMISVGRAFAAGISEQLPDRYPGLRNTGAVELRSALQQLMGEHALLATEVVRRGVKGSRDFEAAAAALNGNTEDFDAALESIYGSEVSGLEAAWRSRIATLAKYAVAAAQDSPRALRRHRSALERLDARLAGELDSISEGNVAEDDAKDALRSLTRQLLAQTDAAATDRLAPADAAAEKAYDAAAALADVIAEGIVAHRPSQFPQQ